MRAPRHAAAGECPTGYRCSAGSSVALGAARTVAAVVVVGTDSNVIQSSSRRYP